MAFLTELNPSGLPAQSGVSDIFSDIGNGVWDIGKNIGTSIIDSTIGKATAKVNTEVDKMLGTTPVAPTVVVPTVAATNVIAPIEPTPAVIKTAATIESQTQIAAWTNWFATLTKENCEKQYGALTANEKTQVEAASKALGIKIPCESVVVKAKNLLVENKNVLIAAVIGAGGFFFSKSLVGAALAGAGSYLLANKFIK